MSQKLETNKKMADFRPRGGNRFGGGSRGGFGGRNSRSSFGQKNFRGEGDRGPVMMHKAICDECKKPCDVPFKPTDGKPVYCKACFDSKKGVVSDRGGDRFPRKSFGDYKTPPRTDFGNDINKVSGSEIKKQIEVLNGKIDKLIKVIEEMNIQKPVKKVAKVKKVNKK
ncbi:MAG: hypothetical protein A2541_01375 [Candidatus Taylorbacteria bacterium RIFOXYD2_FULL_36_9]|uniref:CxxC-x17-CxxC domain-containing protein n=1 Tax=Candidatus Taylorbacteria bacterium RIFOXYD2_FULL_36_9 TaxID=1802338 RepID=A0A1G2PEV5_9BACT|nr:MAG: hypothetical protein A2541_01375 [Candidatus Taylorbacteria bacterium RIFOXYD2_FULL_36_9]